MIDVKQLEATIQTMITQAVNQHVSNAVAASNPGAILAERLDLYLQKALSNRTQSGLITSDAIDWNADGISANLIRGGVIERLRSSGIDDVADHINLTVTNNQVIVENQLVSRSLHVIDGAEFGQASVHGDLHVAGNLIVKGEQFVNQLAGLVDDRISDFNNRRGMDTAGKALTSSGDLLIDSKQLGPTVVESNLRRVGRLRELMVTGSAEIADTVYVEDGRIGVNTNEPAGVFTVWDEEAEFTLRKYQRNTMYLGSTRDVNLAIGVNGQVILEIQKDRITVPAIQIANIAISVSKQMPSGRGQPGELVIMQDIVEGQPWAYQCAGGDKWIALNR